MNDTGQSRMDKSCRTGEPADVPLSTLYQIMASPRCEAVRFLLDAASSPYWVKSLLPGAHVAQVTLATRQPHVPALDANGKIVVGLGATVRHLAESPQPSARWSAIDWSILSRVPDALDVLDREFGRASEILWYRAVLADPDFACALFSIGRGPTRRLIYKSVFPGVAAALRRGWHLDDAATVRAAEEVFRHGLDDAADDYADPNRPTARGLVCAALASWVIPQPWCPFRLQGIAPDDLKQTRDAWAAHPTVALMTDAYRRHRGVSMAENHEIQGSGVI